MALSGVLVIDKPAGMTSAHVVAVARRRLREKRIGHTGTLDPMATGVLPLVVGDGTKIAAFLLADDKAYDARVVLGVSTDTHDADGEIVDEKPVEAAALTPARIAEVLARFRGELEQVPPMHSALKRDGKRLYELARAGEVVDRPPRRITVHRLELTRCEPPELELSIACSKGTYVRALARDIGAALGVGAHLGALRRTASGPFTLEHALPLDELDRDAGAARVVSMNEALAHLPAVVPAPDHAVRIAQGLPRLAAEVAPGVPEGQLIRCLTASGTLLAVARVVGDELRYERVFPCALSC